MVICQQFFKIYNHAILKGWFSHYFFYLLAIGVIKHGVHDVLSKFGFIWVCGSANPCINYSLVVCAFKWHLPRGTETAIGHWSWLYMVTE